MPAKKKVDPENPYPTVEPLEFDRQFDNQSPIQRQIAGRRGWMKPRQNRKELESYKFKRKR